jgi:hypothetical protein
MAKAVKKLDKYSDLQVILQNELPINAARIKFIVYIITALIKVQSVNYQRLAQGFDNEIALSSTLRKIQRFFSIFDLNSDLVARLLFKILPSEVFANGKLQLTLDRTNWKFGVTNINILMLAVIYQGTALPLLWTFLGDKRGNSDQKERIALLERYIRLFGSKSIDFITADREFIGDEWWSFLISNPIRFFIRIRANMQVFSPSKGMVKAYWLFNYFGLNKGFSHPKIVRIATNWVYLSGLKFINDKGKVEFLIVASFCKTEHQMALKMYKKRWQIETMFKAFKSGGFNLEDTHLTDYQRLNKLLLIVAIAFIWAYKVGIYRSQNIKKIEMKKHGRMAKSIFNYGLEFLAQALINCFHKNILLATSIFLSCT